MRAILLVLIFATPALAQKRAAKKPMVPPAVKARIEEHYEARYIKVADPIDLAHAEIKKKNVVRDPDNNKEVLAQLKKEAEERRQRQKIKDIKDWKPEPEWIPVGIQGVAIWVKYNYPLEQAIAQKQGKEPREYDKIFLMDRWGRIFAETDSEHFRKTQPPQRRK